MVLKYFTDGDFRFHSYILKEKVRQCKEKVQTLTESHDLHQSGVATFFIGKKGGAMFQKRRERKRRDREFAETRKIEEELYQLSNRKREEKRK